jgi:hypothetical protein
MRPRFPFRALALSVAAGLAGGCAGGPSNVTPWQSPSTLFAGAAAHMSIDDAPVSRLIAGTWRNASTCQPSAPVRDAGTNASGSGTLFVSDFASSKIEEYDASGTNGTPLGALVNGLNHPWGLFVDQSGTLYVANYNPSNVLEFPRGSSSPSTLSSLYILQPLNVGADNQGNVYVVNSRGGPIMIFPPGQSVPTQLTGFYYPTAVAFDSAWNLYVVDQLYGSKAPLGAVIKFAPGSQTGQNLGLTKLDYPMGIAIDSANDIFVSNIGNNSVTEYAAGATTPMLTIKKGVCNPVFIALNATNDLFVVNNTGGTKGNGTVTGYHTNKKKPFATLTNSMSNPRGIAVDPNS